MPETNALSMTAAEFAASMNPGIAALTEVFGEPISVYSRADALADGVLIDVTEWASSTKGFHGGFQIPVAVTAAVWADVNAIGRQTGQDVRGRAHDLLFLASLAARGAARRETDTVLFQVIMQVGRAKKQTYKLHIGGGDNGEPCCTIMQVGED